MAWRGCCCGTVVRPTSMGILHHYFYDDRNGNNWMEDWLWEASAEGKDEAHTGVNRTELTVMSVWVELCSPKSPGANRDSCGI